MDVSAIEKISDKSLLMLAQTLELSRIKNLFLSFRSCTSVTDVGIEAIAGALPDSLTLLKLDLADCNISDASVDALAGRLQLLPEIGVIQAGGNLGSVSAKHALMEILPAEATLPRRVVGS